MKNGGFSTHRLQLSESSSMGAWFTQNSSIKKRHLIGSDDQGGGSGRRDFACLGLSETGCSRHRRFARVRRLVDFRRDAPAVKAKARDQGFSVTGRGGENDFPGQGGHGRL
jgi:hypothetical protein